MEGDKMELSKIFEPKHSIAKEKQVFSNQDLRKLICPILVEQVLMLLVGIIDTFMVTYAGEAAVSGVSLVNQINSIFIMVFTALASGGAVVVSQYIGRNDLEGGRMASSQLVMVSGVVSLILSGILLVSGKPLLGALFRKIENEVMDACVIYLTITVFSFPALAIYNSCSALFRSMANTKITMYVSLLMNLINIVGNAVGVFVLKAGVAGVAVPSLISRTLAAAVLFTLSFNCRQVVHLRVKQIFRFEKDMIQKILHIAVPNAIENGMLDASKVALSGIVALFGTTQIAANGVAQSFWSMAALFSIVMGPVFITVIGQCAGAGNYDVADYYMKKLLRITYMGSAVWDTVFFGITLIALRFYNLSAETVHLVILLCLIHNVFNALLHPGGFALAAGLRAAGDVKYTMYTSIFATVICRVIFSVLLGVQMNLGVIGVALAMVIDWAVRWVLITQRYLGAKWKAFRVI